MFLILGAILGLVLLVVGVPIFVVFAITGAIILTFHLHVSWFAMGITMFSSVTKYILVAIPLFIFAGYLMLHGGIARRLVNMFIAYFGHLRGGLVIAAILSVGLFSAISGSILSSIITIGTIIIPEMDRAGYPRTFSAALIACVAGVDALIPPSNIAIIYASVTGCSVAKLFMAGMIPGLVQIIILLVVGLLMSRGMSASKRASWRERALATYVALPTIILPIVILGGIYTGIFLPTESAAVACVLCLFIGFFIYRELTWKKVWTALMATAKTSCIIFIIIATASLLSQTMVYTRLPQQITEYIVLWGVTPVTFFLLAALVSLIIGTFMEAIPALLISVPVFYAIAMKLGVDPIHLYVPICIFSGIGLLTPPVAVGVYTAASISKESPQDIFRVVFPWMFLGLCLSGVINIFFPELALWLPGTMD